MLNVHDNESKSAEKGMYKNIVLLGLHCTIKKKVKEILGETSVYC